MASRLSLNHQSCQLERRKRHDVEDDFNHERPQKRIKSLLDEDDSSGDGRSTASGAGGVMVSDKKSFSNRNSLTVNQEFARRFEHNKKREELQKCKSSIGCLYYVVLISKVQEKYASDESSTDSEEEDDDGILASEALDAQITNTLEAIRRKDPRVYDEKVKFYTDPEKEAQDTLDGIIEKEKPMYLSDYHRKNLLQGNATDYEADDAPTTYAQQQNDLKDVVVKEMHAAANGDANSGEDQSDEGGSDDGFLVRKPSRLQETFRPNQAKWKQQDLDVETADRDPETYLANFMSARAWVPSDGSRFQPFESDDEEEERQAEAFEEAYNLRFEDPKTSNEKLLSHARDAAARYSVRKEEMNPRKKAREADRAQKDAARQIREEEKARMRKLKVAEAEEKINKIKEAAGLREELLQEEDWSAFLEEGWDDARWEQQIKRRFGDDYYADHDLRTVIDGEVGGKRKIKKPKWEDDIDIGDLVQGFDAAEKQRPQFSLTEDESDSGGAPIADTVYGLEGHPDEKPNAKKKANRRREKDEEKKSARKERQKIERLVDQQMDVDETLSNFSKKHVGHFRYRETSPTAYGLTAHDILMASDSQLNQYAGLKKMAAFRDPDKKRKDKKHLSKKARLRQWRKDAFGNEQGPQKTLAEVLAEKNGPGLVPKVKKANVVDIGKAKKNRTRSKKSRGQSNPGSGI